MPRTKSRRKPTQPRRNAVPRESRVLQEIKNRRYLAFVRAILSGMARGTR